MLHAFARTLGLIAILVGLGLVPNDLATAAPPHADLSTGPSDPMEFRTDIMPIFSRYGCNAAECHGSATGRGDFKLSLFGGDWSQDFEAVANQLEGRRVNRLSPDRSLLLTKPTEQLSHGGGEVFESDSEAALRIRTWIAAGATDETTRIIQSITVSTDRLVTDDNRVCEIQVSAQTNLGERPVTRPVTRQATFTSSNPSALEILGPGRFRVLRPGKYFLLVRYLGFAKRVTILRPFAETARHRSARKGEAAHSLVDRHVVNSANELGIECPPPADDRILIRRLYLDLVGRLPTPAETDAFLALQKTESNRQSATRQVVDRLLASTEFETRWSFWLRKTLHFRIPGNDLAAADTLSQWLSGWIRDDRGFDELASELLTATGDATQRPAANYHRFFSDGRAEAESVADSFLGIKIGCANCHNHPLDRWTQEDYHGLAAIFATIQRGPTVSEFPAGNVIQPKTGQPAIPRIPGERDLQPNAMPHRQQFANWLVDSPQFSRAFVNRIWKQLLGRGIVEPVDDLRISNPPIDAELLHALARKFQADGFRLKPLIREIICSRVYASRPSQAGPQRFLAGYVTTPIEPAILYDISRQMLTTQQKLPSATSQIQPEQWDPSLGLLSGCTSNGCEIGAPDALLGLREKLHLINGEFLNRWIVNTDNRFGQQFAQGQSAVGVIESFYVRGFSRVWTENEHRFWNEQIQQLPIDAASQTQFLEDAIWSLMTSREFTTNH
jgi:hypothetical protein